VPDITFILPHWIYWGGIIAVPALFMLASRRFPARERAEGSSLRLAYFFLVVGGIMGIHRLYLKSWWAALFIALFVGVIWCNHEAKLTRNAHSIAKNEAFNASYDLNLARDEGDEEARIAELEADLEAKTAREAELAEELAAWRGNAGALALAIFLLMLADAALMPRVVRGVRSREEPPQAVTQMPEDVDPVPAATGSNAFVRMAGRINGFAGEFAAFWTVIAVFVFYYEVVARYIFNSPTIWAHESMFLLFGAQYMLAGGFCLRENAHVRVDVLYLHLSARGRAIADLCTSAFFLIFTGSLLVTGWIFFHDSFSIGQVSHTEWEIAHWPIKFSLPLGGALILMQGIARLTEDVAALKRAGA